jgi:hypothetical protein
MDILKEALRAAARGEVRSAIIATMGDVLTDIGNNVQALLFEHSQETFVAIALSLGASSIWFDYLDEGIITFADFYAWIDEALAEMERPGPICTQCVRVTRCGICAECGKSVCRGCLIEHLERHGVL